MTNPGKPVRETVGWASARLVSARRPKASVAIGLAIAAAAILACAASHAQDYWSVMSGNWSVVENWNAGLPNSNSDAYIANGGTATVTLPDEMCINLYLGDPTSINAGTIQISAGSLYSLNEYVGNNGAGTFNQSGGVNNIYNSLYVSAASGSTGSYTLSGGQLLTNSPEFVGYSGEGTFTQSGGTNTANASGLTDFFMPAICLGWNPGSSGSYTLSGSGVLSASMQDVGYSGTGTFIQTGGTNNCGSSGSLWIGLNSGGSGTYSLSGSGLLSATSQYVGYSGTGTFVQTGGTNSLGSNGSLYVGVTSGGSGTCSLSGSGLLSAFTEYIGSSGTGVFNQTGGTNSLGSNGSLYLGVNLSGSGVYNLSSSGTLSAFMEYVGSSGTGTFNQLGGLNSVNYLSIDGLGRYQFSGGTLEVTGYGLAGQGIFDATNSTGVLNVTGNAIVDLSQATLVNTSSMSLSVGPNSLLLLPAGFNPTTAFLSYSNLGLTHNVGTPLTILPGQGFQGYGSISDLVICQGTITWAGTNGWINLSGGVMVSGTGAVNFGLGTLSVNDSRSGISSGSINGWYACLGTSGNGTFTQSGGAATFGSSFLNVGTLSVGCNPSFSGVYNLSSGTLYANTENIGGAGPGTFNQTGGSNAVAYLNVGSQGCYQFTGGTLQLAGGGGVFGVPGGGLANQGVFDAMGRRWLAGRHRQCDRRLLHGNLGEHRINVIDHWSRLAAAGSSRLQSHDRLRTLLQPGSDAQCRHSLDDFTLPRLLGQRVDRRSRVLSRNDLGRKGIDQS